METGGDPTERCSGMRLTAACLGTARQPGSKGQIVRYTVTCRKGASFNRGPRPSPYSQVFSEMSEDIHIQF